MSLMCRAHTLLLTSFLSSFVITALYIVCSHRALQFVAVAVPGVHCVLFRERCSLYFVYSPIIYDSSYVCRGAHQKRKQNHAASKVEEENKSERCGFCVNRQNCFLFHVVFTR